MHCVSNPALCLTRQYITFPAPNAIQWLYDAMGAVHSDQHSRSRTCSGMLVVVSEGRITGDINILNMLVNSWITDTKDHLRKLRDGASTGFVTDPTDETKLIPVFPLQDQELMLRLKHGCRLFFVLDLLSYMAVKPLANKIDPSRWTQLFEETNVIFPAAVSARHYTFPLTSLYQFCKYLVTGRSADEGLSLIHI